MPSDHELTASVPADSTPRTDSTPQTDSTTPAAPADVLSAGDRGSHDLLTFLRGFCMGAADTVPGISGGTIALILGHYGRLLGVISSFNLQALQLFKAGQFRQLWRACDLRFASVLLLGIIVGAGSLASTMHWLLENRTAETFAVFFGLVLASSWIVFRWISRWSPAAVAVLIAGVAFAYWLAGLSVFEIGLSRSHLFLSAMVAICAMILPGISGAFVLLLLGMYHPVIDMIKRFASLDISLALLLDLTAFASGCLVGLLLFTRLLRWCLQAHPNATLAGLLGLMIGSARRIWPLQQPSAATAHLEFEEQEFILVSVSEWPTSVWPLVLLAIGAAAVVIGTETAAERLAASPPADESA